MTVFCRVLQAVIEEIIKMEHVPVRVNGPMGGESILAQGYDHLLMIAGGVAVSMHHCFPTLFCIVCPPASPSLNFLRTLSFALPYPKADQKRC